MSAEKVDQAPAPKTDNVDPAAVKPDPVDLKAGGAEPEIKPDDGITTPLNTDPKDDIKAPSDWPDDWREKYASDDEKLLKRLQRFGSPKAMMDSYFDLEKRLNSGDYKKDVKLSDNPTEEELSEYRKANGIPEKASDYDLDIGDGYVIGDDDKPLVDAFLNNMHAKNASPDVVKAALKSYYEIQQQNESQRKESFAQMADEAVRELMGEYGGDYKRNINIVTTFMDNQFGEDADLFNNAIAGDGKPLMSHSNVIRKILSLATEIDPVATISPGAGRSGAQGISDRISEIESYMKTNRRDYFKNQSLQDEYKNLLTARDRYAAR